MSTVTNVLLTASFSAVPQVQKKLDAWAEEQDCAPFLRVDVHCGGDKYMEAAVWGGAFDCMALAPLMTDLCGNWKYPELVSHLQLLVKGQQDDYFQFYSLSNGGWQGWRQDK